MSVVTRVRRTDAQVEGAREAARIAATLGGELKRTRLKRRLTQRSIGDRVGLSQGRISELERGEGASAPLDTWIVLGLALDRPLAVSFSRDVLPDATYDAGHLRAQELVLRLARAVSRRADFELPTRPANPARTTDIVLRDDATRAVVLVEIWNRIDDLGSAARSTNRKHADAQALAVLAGGDAPYRVASCWLLVDTIANRRLLARYPEIFASRFRGSSLSRVRCLVEGAEPPRDSGLAWIDTRAERITAVRHRRHGDGTHGD